MPYDNLSIKHIIYPLVEINTMIVEFQISRITIRMTKFHVWFTTDFICLSIIINNIESKVFFAFWISFQACFLW